MSRRIVRLAVVSAATAAALGVPAATVIAVADAPSATVQAATATRAPVRLADGRTVTVKGLPTVHYTATSGHRDAVQAAATAHPADGSVPGTNPNVSSSPSADLPGVGTNPTGTGTYDPSQVSTQSTGGIVIGVGGIIVGLIVVSYLMIRHGKWSWGSVLVGFAVGTTLAGAGGLLGMPGNITTSLMTSLSSALNGIS